MKKMNFFGIMALVALIILTFAACDTGGGSSPSPTNGPWTVKFFDGANELIALKKSNVPHDTTITLPAGPTKAGFTFGGWYKEAALTNVWNATTDKVTKDTNIYAKYTPGSGGGDIWTVRFFDDDTELTDLEIEVEDGDTITLPTLPARSSDSFEFYGWYTEKAFSIMWNESAPVTADTVLFARYVDPNETIVKYTVKFFNGDTELTELETEVEDGKSFMLPQDPVKDGHTFDGWYKESNFITKWNATTDTVTADTNLYAKFNASTWTVRFFDGETELEDEKQTGVAHGSTITLPTPTKEGGYTFVAWFREADFTTQWAATDTVTGNISLYAKYSDPGEVITKWTVKFFDGSTELTDLEKTDVVDNATITLPAGPEKTGFTFDGWYKDSISGTKWTNTTPVTANISLYANYTAVTPGPWTVKFIGKDGNEVASLTQSNVPHDTTITLQPGPTEAGFTFDAWYKEAAFTTKWNASTDKVTANISLYGKWEAAGGLESFTITFSDDKPAIKPTVSGSTVYKAVDGKEVISVGFQNTSWCNWFSGWTSTFTLPEAMDLSEYTGVDVELRFSVFDEERCDFRAIKFEEIAVEFFDATQSYTVHSQSQWGDFEYNGISSADDLDAPIKLPFFRDNKQQHGGQNIDALKNTTSMIVYISFITGFPAYGGTEPADDSLWDWYGKDAEPPTRTDRYTLRDGDIYIYSIRFKK